MVDRPILDYLAYKIDEYFNGNINTINPEEDAKFAFSVTDESIELCKKIIEYYFEEKEIALFRKEKLNEFLIFLIQYNIYKSKELYNFFIEKQNQYINSNYLTFTLMNYVNGNYNDTINDALQTHEFADKVNDKSIEKSKTIIHDFYVDYSWKKDYITVEKMFEYLKYLKELKIYKSDELLNFFLEESKLGKKNTMETRASRLQEDRCIHDYKFKQIMKELLLPISNNIIINFNYNIRLDEITPKKYLDPKAPKDNFKLSTFPDFDRNEYQIHIFDVRWFSDHFGNDTSHVFTAIYINLIIFDKPCLIFLNTWLFDLKAYNFLKNGKNFGFVDDIYVYPNDLNTLHFEDIQAKDLDFHTQGQCQTWSFISAYEFCFHLITQIQLHSSNKIFFIQKNVAKQTYIELSKAENDYKIYNHLVTTVGLFGGKRKLKRSKRLKHSKKYK